MRAITIPFCILISFVGSGFSYNNTILQKYLNLEKAFISDLESYIESQESVLQLLRKKLLNFKVEHSDALDNPESYFSNELNKFLFIKRLSKDMNNLSDKTFDVAQAFKSRVSSYKRNSIVPSNNDLISSAVSIAKLQQTQKLRTEKLARGIFGDVKRRWMISIFLHWRLVDIFLVLGMVSRQKIVIKLVNNSMMPRCISQQLSG